MPPRQSRRSPPFCPNPDCDFHQNPDGWRFLRWGTFRRRRAPQTVQRYRCTRCRRCFSDQTFSTTYWLKRADLLTSVFDGLANSVALRQLARVHRAAPSTIQTHTERVARHSLLFSACHRPQLPPAEAVAVDGFESFAFSQYHPLHVNVAVGAESHFLYAFTEAELRRKGRMTPFQKEKRRGLEARFGRAHPKAIERAMAEIVRQLAPEGGRVVLRSDEHPSYPRAFAGVEGVAVAHERTPSKAARTTGNPLFPVNRLDLLVRHSGANHKRETIAYSKRLGAVAERFAVFAVWFNFQKSRSEKRQDATPAQALGLVEQKLTTRQILAERLFPTRIRLPDWSRRIYERRVPTRGLPTTLHHRVYAN